MKCLFSHAHTINPIIKSIIPCKYFMSLFTSDHLQFWMVFNKIPKCILSLILPCVYNLPTIPSSPLLLCVTAMPSNISWMSHHLIHHNHLVWSFGGSRMLFHSFYTTICEKHYLVPVHLTLNWVLILWDMKYLILSPYAYFIACIIYFNDIFVLVI